jgi:hypothetical protein
VNSSAHASILDATAAQDKGGHKLELQPVDWMLQEAWDCGRRWVEVMRTVPYASTPVDQRLDVVEDRRGDVHLQRLR